MRDMVGMRRGSCYYFLPLEGSRTTQGTPKLKASAFPSQRAEEREGHPVDFIWQMEKLRKGMWADIWPLSTLGALKHHAPPPKPPLSGLRGQADCPRPSEVAAPLRALEPVPPAPLGLSLSLVIAPTDAALMGCLRTALCRGRGGERTEEHPHFTDEGTEEMKSLGFTHIHDCCLKRKPQVVCKDRAEGF